MGDGGELKRQWRMMRMVVEDEDVGGGGGWYRIRMLVEDEDDGLQGRR